MKNKWYKAIAFCIALCSAALLFGASVDVVEDFNSVANTTSLKGVKMGNPVFALTDDGFNKTKGLLVSGRTSNYFGYAYDVSAFIGNSIDLSSQVCAYKVASGATNTIMATLKTTNGSGDQYKQIATVEVTGTNWAALATASSYQIPADAESALLYFETTQDVSYIIDEVSVTVSGTYKKPGESIYVDISGYPILKSIYKDYFKINVACEALSHWNRLNPLSEIGNPAKEALIKSQFDGITFGNELKPAYNMGYSDPAATEKNLPFVIDTSAKEMLDWAKANNMKVRGHVLIWHSQCSDEVFCKGYKPVYTDSKKTQLDPSCLVSRSTMLARMKSYIESVMEYMYKNGYANVINAWDVVNEAIEPGVNKYNLRESYWYKTIGADFVYYAFKYTRNAVDKFAPKYASVYNISKSDKTALATIKPALFYNDYNEYQPEKRDAIIQLVTRKVKLWHSIVGDKLIDGIGMQGHINDNADIDSFITALKMYDDVVDQVHVTELDVTQTTTGANASYYQAALYQKLFTALVDARKAGSNLTAVTFWGLTDENSWKKEGKPLLFDFDLSKKLAFDAVTYAVTGGKLPEPAFIAPDYKDLATSFDGEGATPESEGFTPRGSATLSIQSDVVFSGNSALKVAGRTASWNGVCFDVTRFLGQTIQISGMVKSESEIVKVSADIDGVWPNISEVNVSDGKWHKITGVYKIPSTLTGLKLYFESDTTNDIYVDDVQVKLIGLKEDFEGDTNIALPCGTGHVSHLTVTDKECKSATHSLLATREAKEASVKFDVSKYIGFTVDISAYIKTTDKKARLFFDGAKPLQLAEVAAGGDWVKVSAKCLVPNELTSAAVYFETDGSSDIYLDDFSVTIADVIADCESDGSFYTTRWGGAGTLTIKDDGTGNKAAVLTDKTESYFGVAFDVTSYLGMEVEISADVKTDDATIKLSGDIENLWPNYITAEAKKGSYTTIKGVIRLPSNIPTLKLYIETDGKSDIYVDNVTIKRVL